MRDKKRVKILRVVGIVLMGLTAAFTLMGGAGTTCVALNPTGFGGNFAGIAPYQWLYILFVLVTIAIGILGMRAAVLLVEGSKKAFSSALTALIAGVAVGGLHMIVSRSLRGGSMPVDMVVYSTVLTLVYFLIFRSPSIWQRIDPEEPLKEGNIRKNALAIVFSFTGMLTLAIQHLMAPTHTIGGINYADAWHATLSLLGAGLVLMGAITAISIFIMKMRTFSLLVIPSVDE